MKDIEIGKLYVVYILVPHAKNPLKGFPSLTDSIGAGENGGFADYLLVDASELVPVVSTHLSIVIDKWTDIHDVFRSRTGSHPKLLRFLWIL